MLFIYVSVLYVKDIVLYFVCTISLAFRNMCVMQKELRKYFWMTVYIFKVWVAGEKKE
jgi:hypothetical protein